MAGLFGVKNLSTDYYKNMQVENNCANLLNDVIEYDGMYAERHLNKKFSNDKVFQKDDRYFIAIDGIILNSRQLTNKYKANTLFEAIALLYEEYKHDFIKELSGNFCGFFSDIKNDVHLIFNNLAGSKNVFYSVVDDKIIFSSDINYVIRYFKLNDIDYTLNEKAVKSMLGHPYLYDTATFFNEIKRLLHGYCIVIKDNKPELVQYYNYFDKVQEGKADEEIYEKFDVLFKQAVKNAFEKDKEYGYNHIVCLSAGLDCKMVTWIAHEMGYSRDITNVTYSQPDFWDEIVPKRIAQDLEHRYIFQSLANGLLSLDIDINVKANGGSYYYLGIAQGTATFRNINMDEFGIIHSGVFSDIPRGNFYSLGTESFDLNSIYKSNKYLYNLLSDEEQDKMRKIYGSNTNYYLYLVGSNSENTQFAGLSSVTEMYSPFFSKELLDFCLTIPFGMRNMSNMSNMYNNWIIQKHPKAASYIWDKTGTPLINLKNSQKTMNSRKVTIPFCNKTVTVGALKSYIRAKTVGRLPPWRTDNTPVSMRKSANMNPMDYWYATSKSYKDSYDRYFNENIDRLLFDKELYAEAKEVYLNLSGNHIGTAKARVLTILSVLKNYFD